MNGHTIGFRPQTQKLQLHYMSTLEVKRLKKYTFSALGGRKKRDPGNEVAITCDCMFLFLETAFLDGLLMDCFLNYFSLGPKSGGT